MKEDLIAIGWDVRGWQNRNQATAAVRLGADSRKAQWLGISKPFRLKAGSELSFEALAKPAVGRDHLDYLRSASKLAVAIDAPLAFPNAFRYLLGGKALSHTIPKIEIENRFAYRDCERWVKEKFGKKPLSASFDKLGNNASLAMVAATALQKEGFEVVPQNTRHAGRSLIEVYPGLVKIGSQKVDPAIPQLALHLPKTLRRGSDQYDAAICAILGLVFLDGGKRLDLPDLIPFPDDADPKEGWIFTLPSDKNCDQNCV